MIAALLPALLVAGTLSPLEQDQIDRHVRGILSDTSYGFCHDEGYPLTYEEEEWCPLYADNPRCPALEHACDAPRGELIGPPGRLSQRTVRQSDAPEEAKKPERRREPEPREIEIPALGGVAELMFWAVLLIAVVALVIAIARNVAKGKAPEAKPEEQGKPEDPGVAAAAAARRAMETDVDRLLAMARDCATRGEYADAVDFTHAALLRRLDHDGLIRLHRARTNGDYVRDLRTNAELHGPVREALRRVDRAQFGNAPPERSMFEDIMQRIVAIVKRAGPIAALAVAVLVGAFACDAESTKSYPWGRSPSGTDALVALLEARGFEAAHRGTRMDAFADDTKHGGLVIVLLEGSEVSEAEWIAIDTWLEEGGRLVVAGGHVPPWLQIEGRYRPSAEVERTWVVEERERDFSVPYVIVPATGEIVFGGTRGEPLLVREEAVYAATFERGLGRIVVLADDHLFTNASLPVADNAIFVETLLRDLGHRVELVDAWSGAGADDPLESISRTHLTAAVVQLLLLIVVLYLWRGVRFGRPRDPIPPSRRAFVQHAVAMGNQYTRARATGHAAAAYATWVLDRLRDRYPIASAGGLHGLAQHVALRSRRDDTEIMRLLVEAHGAAESRMGDGRAASSTIARAPAIGSPSEDLALVRDLGRLMRELSSRPTA